jgi:hypothetical protein
LVFLIAGNPQDEPHALSRPEPQLKPRGGAVEVGRCRLEGEAGDALRTIETNILQGDR